MNFNENGLDDFDILMEIESFGSDIDAQDQFGLLGMAIASQTGLGKKIRGAVHEARINRLVGKIARIYEKGKVDKAKKLAAKIGRIVQKIQSLDPEWSPSPQVQSWVEFGLGAAGPNAGTSGYESEAPGYAPAPSYDAGSWDADISSDLQGVLSTPIQVVAPGGGYQAPGATGGYLPMGSRSIWEDPNVVAVPVPYGPTPGWGVPPAQASTPSVPRPFRPRPGRTVHHHYYGPKAGPSFARRPAPIRKAIPKAIRPRPFAKGPRRRFGADEDAFGVLPGFRDIQKRLQSKRAAYEKAKRLGHIKRAERLAKDIQELQAKIAQAQSMSTFATSTVEIPAYDDADIVAEVEEIEFQDVDPSEITVVSEDFGYGGTRLDDEIDLEFGAICGG